MLDKQFTVLDLFCGCGGLSLGFAQAGCKIKIGLDIWADAIKTFSSSHPEAQALVIDLATVTPQELTFQSGITQVDLIIGGPPCQGFSLAGKRLIDDERNQLYKAFVSYVEHYQPQAFLMENVPNIMSMGKGIFKEQIIADFSQLGYKVFAKILVASDYGVPQKRKRAFFIGFKEDCNYEFPAPTIIEPITAEQALSDLPEYSLPNGSAYPLAVQSSYQQQMRQQSSSLYNHQITQHSSQTINTIALVPDGGNYKDLPAALRDSRKVNIAWTRLHSKKPSFTIDTGHRHHFHYQFNRVPTVRESARLQSFPDTFIFLGSKTSQYKQVGNAVPPLLAQVLAKSIVQQLHKNQKYSPNLQ